MSLPADNEGSPRPLAAQDFLLPIFLMSGAAGLIYEVLWTHQFANVVGSASESMAVVFCVFLAFLALGAIVCGQSELLHRHALMVYALFEAGIGVLGAGSCLGLLEGEFALIRWLPQPEGALARLAVQVAVVSIFVGPGAFLMGGTLPVMVEGIKRWALPSRVVTRLYGINTVGASLGALLPGLWLIPAVGFRATALVAASLNFAAAGSMLLLLFWDRRRVQSNGAAALPAEAPNGSPGGETACPAPSAERRLGLGWFYLLSFFSGCGVLALEQGWGRLARFSIGNRALALSVLLFGILLFLGAGSLACRPLLAWVRRRMRQPAEAVLAAALLASGVLQLVFAAANLSRASGGGPSDGFAIVSFLAQMALPFFTAGLVFPWLLASFPSVDRDSGVSVGILYATNVAGSTVGSLFSTFFLFEWIGTSGLLWVVSLLFASLGWMLCARWANGRRRMGWLGGIAALWVGLAVVYPYRWVPAPQGLQVLDVHEDDYGVQVLLRDAEGTLAALNNGVRLVAGYGQPNTTYAQQLQADIPMLLARHTEKVFNLGTGYGITAGAFTLWGEAVRSVVTVEILPFMARHQRDFAGENHSYLDRPEVRLVVADGRQKLLASRESFDIISVNPLDPRLPGSSSLCTVEFWQAAKERLNPGGVYAQLAFGPREVLVEGFARVFPSFLVFRAYRASYLLVGWRDGGPMPAFEAGRITEAVRSVYRRFGIADLEVFLSELRALAEIETGQLRRLIERAPAPVLHTGDRPILEYQGLGGSVFRVPDEVW